MAIQTVNIGAVPNDGTGDSARTSFDKLNQNFTDPANGAAALVQTSPTDTTSGRVVTTGALADNGGPIFTEANLSPFVFTGDATNDIVAVGYAPSATTLSVPLDCLQESVPISITVNGTFRILDLQGSSVDTGLTPALSSISSGRAAIVNFSTSGLTVGDTYYVACDSGTSSITVNF